MEKNSKSVTITPMSNNEARSTGKLIKSAILITLAFVLSYVEIPIIPAAAWLKLDFSSLPLLFGALSYGASQGLLSTLILQLLIFFIKGSTTGGIGEIANFIMLGTFIVLSALIYRRIKNIKGLILGSIVGTVALIIAAILSNAYILIPLFFPNGFPGGDESLRTYLYTLIPLFNFIKGSLISILGLLTYEKLGFLIRKESTSIKANPSANAA